MIQGGLSDKFLKLKDRLRALQWAVNNLSVPLQNGEKMLFDVIMDNMKQLVNEIEKEIL
jgi:hypothetical protein